MHNHSAEKHLSWVAILKPYLKPFYRTIILAMVFMIIDSFLTALRPWPLKVIIDKVLNGHNIKIPFIADWINNSALSSMSILYVACIAMLVIAIGTGTFSYLFTRLMGNFSQRFIFNLKIDTFHHLQGLSLHFHTQKRLGDIMTRLTSDIDSLQVLTAKGAMLFLTNFFLMFSRLVMMFWLNWRFSLIACAVLPLLFLMIWWHTTKIQSVSRVARASDGEMASIAQETLGSISIVKGLAQEKRQDQLFIKQGKKSLEGYMERVTHQARMAPIIDLLAAAGLTLVMFFGAKGVMAGNVTIGDMIVFFFYVSNFYSPLQAMSRQFGNFSNGIAGAERVAEVLAKDSYVKQNKNAKSAPRFTGQVEFKNVSFEYEQGQSVLKDISLTIKAGEHIAIIGATGAGKSTIASLLLRFYDPIKGSILIDGIDIREFSIDSLRNQIGLILQDSFLLAGTIRENITFGCKEIPEEAQIINAAKAAGAHEFINESPKGYDSHVSEGGANLSGGQRQRIAVARAIIRDVPILLLDEPTSKLDNIFEASVLETLKTRPHQPTVIMITHSLRAASMADTIVILENGKIVEYGSPEELGNNGEKFNKYIQAGIFVK
ncbi:MAG: ABC transporter ATP-binding protein [Porphyromonadaceae bacterium]|nr:MAG: ABC transporter ATP-binding protein [Porphyromonadaceae bacterium]